MKKKYYTETERKQAACTSAKKSQAKRRRENGEEVRAYHRNYRAKNRAQVTASRRQWYKDARTSLDYVLRARCDNAKQKAKRLGVPFEMTVEYLQALYVAHPRCALTDLEFELTNKARTISIDRIVPAQGYVAGNVRLVLWQVNVARGAWGDAPLIEMAHAIAAKYPRP
jgi:hypothetical protein